MGAGLYIITATGRPYRGFLQSPLSKDECLENALNEARYHIYQFYQFIIDMHSSQFESVLHVQRKLF
jgi:hypothetical protein